MMWTFERMFGRAICFKGGGGGATRIITDDMVAEAEVATKEWNRYVTDHLPMERLFVADKTAGNEQDQFALRGQINADLAQAAKGLGTVSAGANPQQTLTGKAVAGAGLAKQAAGALTDVTQKAEDREVQDLGTVVAMGRGQAVEAQEGIGGLAESSAQAALTKAKADQQARFAEEQATAKLAGSVANTATTIGMYGADKGWFSSAPEAPTLTPYGNAYSFDSATGSFNVQPKPSAKLSLMTGGLSY